MKVIDKVPKATIDALMGGNLFNAATTDAATAGGLAFLQGELEKRDPKVREPLTTVTWMRDIVCKTGGGWVDFTSTFNVNYGTSGPNMYGLMGGETTSIPLMQADVGKDIFPAFPWANILKVPYVDMQKLQQVGRSLDDMLDKGIRLNWNKTCDLMVYQGFGGNAGIVNNTNVTATAVSTSGAAVTWAAKLALGTQVGLNAIMNDINTAMLNTWVASEYDVTGMANHILLPPAQYNLLATTIVSVTGAAPVSLLTYLLENNIGKTQGVDLQIFPSRWCIGAGASGKDRMVAYVNDEDRLYFDMTVPIQRAMTQPDVKEAAYLTLYVGQLGVPKFLYLAPVAYFDGL